VKHYIDRIKTGVRGMGYVKVDESAAWPEWLEKGLLTVPQGGAGQAPAAAAPESTAKSN
jgi:HlyD family secretion protein